MAGRLQALRPPHWHYTPPLDPDDPNTTYVERLSDFTTANPNARIRLQLALCQHCDQVAQHIIDGYGFCDEHVQRFDHSKTTREGR